MRKLIFLFGLSVLFSCTSNTILEEPEDLIPKDTMSLVIQEMFIASTAKFFNNKNLQKNINYMPFVYERFKIDSVRFQRSNLYYMSKIDDYQKILNDVKASLEEQKRKFDGEKTYLDSIRKDSIRKVQSLNRRNFDTIKKEDKLKPKDKKQ